VNEAVAAGGSLDRLTVYRLRAGLMCALLSSGLPSYGARWAQLPQWMQMAFGEGNVRLVDGIARDRRGHFVRVLREEARAAACTIQGGAGARGRCTSMRASRAVRVSGAARLRQGARSSRGQGARIARRMLYPSAISSLSVLHLLPFHRSADVAGGDGARWVQLPQ